MIIYKSGSLIYLIDEEKVDKGDIKKVQEIIDKVGLVSYKMLSQYDIKLEVY